MKPGSHRGRSRTHPSKIVEFGPHILLKLALKKSKKSIEDRDEWMVSKFRKVTKGKDDCLISFRVVFWIFLKHSSGEGFWEGVFFLFLLGAKIFS